jgi:hypothetical protein
MKAISQKTENLWLEVERALSEHTASGYKMACIEAEKVFYYKLREKGYPTGNIKRILTLFGWKLTNKDSLAKALEKTEQIKTVFEYTLSSFEAEDIVAAFKDAVSDFSHAKALSWQRKLTVFWDNYVSYKSSFAKMTLLVLFIFFLAVKFLSATKIGGQLVTLAVSSADFIFSWFLLLLGIGAIVALVAFGAVTWFEKRQTKIREIK